MAIVGLVGFAGVVVFGLLYVVFLFRGVSLKLPAIGMAVFALVIAAAAVIPMLDLSLPTLPALPFFGGEPSQTEKAEHPDGGETEAPGAGGFPQLLLDKRGLVITATGLNETNAQGPMLNLSMENRSGTDVTVEVRDIAVNGWMMDLSFSVAVSAGRTASRSVLFPTSEMQKNGIDAIASIAFSFHVLDSNRITFLDSGPVTVRIPAADTYQYRLNDSGEELYNDNGVRVISKGFSGNESVFGPGLVLSVENNTDRTITVQARDVLIDAVPADAAFSEDILPGKRSAAAIVISGASLEDIREMSFCLRVTDRDRRTVLFDTEPFTVVV